MLSSLSNLADSLSDGLHNYKCRDYKSCLKYISTKDNQLIFKCRKCELNNYKGFNKTLIKRFANIYIILETLINLFCY